jgi:hypothetical protein
MRMLRCPSTERPLTSTARRALSTCVSCLLRRPSRLEHKTGCFLWGHRRQEHVSAVLWDRSGGPVRSSDGLLPVPFEQPACAQTDQLRDKRPDASIRHRFCNDHRRRREPFVCSYAQVQHHTFSFHTRRTSSLDTVLDDMSPSIAYSPDFGTCFESNSLSSQYFEHTLQYVRRPSLPHL